MLSNKKRTPSKRTPSHPGDILSEEFLKPLNLSQSQFAAHLSGTWTQSKISDIVNKKRRVTEVIALDFADALNTSPEFWLNLQLRYDLWFAEQEHDKIPCIPQLKTLSYSKSAKHPKRLGLSQS